MMEKCAICRVAGYDGPDLDARLVTVLAGGLINAFAGTGRLLVETLCTEHRDLLVMLTVQDAPRANGSIEMVRALLRELGLSEESIAAAERVSERMRGREAKH